MIEAISASSLVSGMGTSATVSRPSAQTAGPSPGTDFGSVLGNIAASAIGTLEQGEAAAIQGIQGSMPMQQVVDRVLDAERTLQATLAIRDKLVSSFLEISRMQI